jgi:hypothetical protein
VTDEKKADWSEWGRFTLTALGGILVGIVSSILWLSDVAHKADAAVADNVKQDAVLQRLTDISGDIRVAIAQLVAQQAANDSRIRALEDKSNR